MPALADDPLLVFRMPWLLLAGSFVTLWLSASVGASAFKRLRAQVGEAREDFIVIQGATLTLLGLLIGFAFSMAIGRYDLRKNYEEGEANAIGTAYVRADLIPAADAAKVRTLLLSYLDQRVLFYTEQDEQKLRQADAATTKLQAELWSAVAAPALAQPSPLMALVVNGMNDVLNSQGYTLAAWRNRIPLAAWALMMTIAICATFLIGVGTKNKRVGSGLLLVLPFVVSVAFFLIADIDSPRRGVIRVVPQNLLGLAQALRAQ
jgi:hypothetical protein